MAEEVDRTAVTAFVEKLVRALCLELTVDGNDSDGLLRVNLSGPDRPILLSNTAAVLNGIEYLVCKIFRSGREEGTESIVLDSDNYRQHREAELVLLAQMASKTVLSQKKPLSLQAMSPKERRIVHLALAGIQGVRSESQGEGDHRSITIYPS
jgi:spoIIIJ-associated protein